MFDEGGEKALRSENLNQSERSPVAYTPLTTGSTIDFVAGGNDDIEPRIGEMLVDLFHAKKFVLRDVKGAPYATHDLGLVLHGDGHLAVEVTRITDSIRRRQEKSLDEYRSETQALKCRWILMTAQYGTRLNDLRDQATTHLVVLEVYEIQSFPQSADLSRPLTRKAILALRKLGIPQGECTQSGPEEGGHVDIIEVVLQSLTAREFAERVQQEVNANTSKLMVDTREGSILAIWVDSWMWSGRAPMAHELPTDEAMTLPRGCLGVVILRESFLHGNQPDMVWSYGTGVSDLLAAGWVDLTNAALAFIESGD